MKITTTNTMFNRDEIKCIVAVPQDSDSLTRTERASFVLLDTGERASISYQDAKDLLKQFSNDSDTTKPSKEEPCDCPICRFGADFESKLSSGVIKVNKENIGDFVSLFNSLGK